MCDLHPSPTDLARAGRRLAPNAESLIKSPAQMAALFADHPHALANTRALPTGYRFTMADLGAAFPSIPFRQETQASFLRRMLMSAHAIAIVRITTVPVRRLPAELDLIEKLDLAGYFLIVWDIVNYCRQHDILVQGVVDRQQRRLLQPGDYRRRSRRHGPAVRAFPRQRNAASGPTSISICRAATDVSASFSTSTRSAASTARR